jgi:glycosyltransferase involved in cell wall biosynthesis
VSIQPTRLALVTNALYSGGISTFLFRLGRHLAHRGWSVEIVTTEEPGEWSALAERYNLAARHVPGARERSRISHTAAVGTFLVENDYRVILLNHSKHAQASLGMLPDEVFAVPLVHRDDEAAYAVACSNRYAWNCLIAPASGLYTTAQHRTPDRPVVMIPHGVPVPEQAVLGLDRRMHQRLRLAYVGRLQEAPKRVSLLPKIVRAVADRGIDLELRVAGVGPDEALLYRGIEENRMQERIKLLGSLVPLEIYRLLLDSHALLLPSTREGFGLVALEAQACGCVPVCTDLPGVTDAIVENGRTGFLVPSEDLGAFSDAVAMLATDRLGWKQMGSAGYSLVSSQFPLNRMGAAYEKLLLEGLQGRFPLPRQRQWHRPLDLEAIPGQGFLPGAIRSLARWWRSRRGD